MDDLINDFSKFKEKTKYSEKISRIKYLNEQSAASSFWQDYNQAGKLMKELTELQKDINEIDSLENKIKTGNFSEALSIFKKLQYKIFLNGTYDRSDALLSLHSGQGGVEAMDWALMLLRMYQRFAEKKGWRIKEIDRTDGEEAGIKSVTLSIAGSYAYGLLKKEAGTHRLVRKSPFNADNLRQTSFALVEILPNIEEDDSLLIKDEDLEFEAFRSGGHGGQNVNKVSTAVRIKHKPSGIVVACQTERYQAQNRENALKIIKAKLWQIKEEEKKQQEKNLKGEYKIAGWGNQIRSYVLHPYHLVKDLRTGYETGDTDRVLDGDIDDFIEKELAT